MMEYIKGSKTAWFWTILRLYLGYEWLTAGWHKLTGTAPFDAAGFLKGAIAKSVPATAGAKPVVQAWWGDFLNSFALPNVKLFNLLVMWGEILIGLALILGFVTIFAATMGALMNFAFLMSGSTSTNPNLFALSFLIILAGSAASYYGVDHFVMDRIKAYIATYRNRTPEDRKVAV